MNVIPKISSYDLFTGTWLVHDSEKRQIALFWSTTGKVRIYHNSELQLEDRSFKLSPVWKYTFDGREYEISAKPSNKTMTKFEYLMKCEEVILRIFTLKYNFNWKKKILFYTMIFVVTIPLVLYRAPTWVFIITLLGLVALGLVLQRRKLLIIHEYDNPVSFDY